MVARGKGEAQFQKRGERAFGTGREPECFRLGQVLCRQWCCYMQLNLGVPMPSYAELKGTCKARTAVLKLGNWVL
jgi:hypothetical protein